jgi:hypothetical protein
VVLSLYLGFAITLTIALGVYTIAFLAFAIMRSVAF